MDLNVTDKIYSIRDAISSSPQITIFTGPSDKNVATMARNLLHEFSEIVDADRSKLTITVKKSLKEVFYKLHGLINEQAGVIKTLQLAIAVEPQVPSYADVVQRHSAPQPAP